MHQMVEDYIAAQKSEESKHSLETKNQLLLKLGLFEKEYSAKNEYSSEYPEREYIEQTGDYKYFKKIPIDVSDEEFSEILKYQKNGQSDAKTSKNTYSSLLQGIAFFLFIVGLIAGIVAGNTPSLITGAISNISGSHGFSFAPALVTWILSFIGGMLFLGFAEIIQLLTDIKNK